MQFEQYLKFCVPHVAHGPSCFVTTHKRHRMTSSSSLYRSQSRKASSSNQLLTNFTLRPAAAAFGGSRTGAGGGSRTGAGGGSRTGAGGGSRTGAGGGSRTGAGGGSRTGAGGGSRTGAGGGSVSGVDCSSTLAGCGPALSSQRREHVF